MKYTLTLFIFILSIHCSFAQETTYIIDYDLKKAFKQSPTSFTSPSSLFIQPKNSALYKIKYGATPEEKVEDPNNLPQGNVIVVEGSDAFYFRKEGDTTLIYDDHIIFRHFTVKDQPKFNWTLTNDSKKVLGYNCQKATANFRGRTYEAYFTADLGIQGAPWKFYGLPGLILHVYSIDGVFEITATGINTVKDIEPLENPLDTTKMITWEQYKKKYERKYYGLMNMVIGDGHGNSASMPKMQLELLVEDRN
ncbi:hypothetical protein GCM10009430_09080 [Aquimarina litoralis]|uniref:GLPGLI family protein n=1 Tax=Aquimarina litoralis TaxID=584605 RepID=A0ABP3TPY9_9FLAO